MENSVSKYFKENLSDWFGKKGGYVKTFVDHHQNNDLEIPSWRLYFDIPLEEEVLFTYDGTFWGSHKAGLVMTNVAIYCKQDKDSPRIVFPWEKISSIVYKENTFFFYYDAYSTSPGRIPAFGYFFPSQIDSNDMYGQYRIGDLLAYHLTCMANLAGKSSLARIKDIEENEEKTFEDALALFDELQADVSNCQDGMLCYHLGSALVHKASPGQIDSYTCQRIEATLKKARGLLDNRDLQDDCLYLLATLYADAGQNAKARNTYILAMDSVNETIAKSAQQLMLFQEEMLSLSGIWDDYVNQIDYKDRKFLMPINDNEIAGCYVSGIETFRMSNIPSCIDFSAGHPIAKELYIGHPYKPSIYVPYSESEEFFFVDKIDELTYLLQCLGAEDITITSIKGRNLSELSSRSGDYSIHADIETTKVSGAGSNSSSREQSSESTLHHSFHIKCDPMKYPYVPEGLIWYREQPRWQRMVEGRLNGNRLEYSESISSTDTRFVSNTEMQDIKAAAEYLWVKVDGSAESNLKSQFKERTETQWRVDVRFRSLRDFSESQIATSKSVMSLSSDEEEYIEIFKEYAADGELSERDRRMLEKFRDRCDISKERAMELEASCNKPKLTEDEQEYLEMYKEYASEGAVSERDRKMLNKMRDRMGISEERAKEIEQL